MRINRLLGVIAILLLISAGSLCAQDIVKVKGVQGRWQVSEEITLKQAEERAFMEAKKAALQELLAPSRYSRGIATGSGTDGMIVTAMRNRMCI